LMEILSKIEIIKDFFVQLVICFTILSANHA